MATWALRLLKPPARIAAPISRINIPAQHTPHFVAAVRCLARCCANRAGLPYLLRRK
jgi:hypothetical protein